MCCDRGWPVMFLHCCQVAEASRGLNVSLQVPSHCMSGVGVVCDWGDVSFLACFRSTTLSKGHFIVTGVVVCGGHFGVRFFLTACGCGFFTAHVGCGLKRQ